MTDSVNAINIKTEDELERILSSLGFQTRHYDRLDFTVIRRVTKEFSNEPCRCIIAQDNNLASHSLVIVEDNMFCVYYYDFPNDLFRIWEELRGDINLSTLREVIVASTIEEAIKKRLSY